MKRKIIFLLFAGITWQSYSVLNSAGLASFLLATGAFRPECTREGVEDDRTGTPEVAQRELEDRKWFVEEDVGHGWKACAKKIDNGMVLMPSNKKVPLNSQEVGLEEERIDKAIKYIKYCLKKDEELKTSKDPKVKIKLLINLEENIDYVHTEASKQYLRKGLDMITLCFDK